MCVLSMRINLKSKEHGPLVQEQRSAHAPELSCMPIPDGLCGKSSLHLASAMSSKRPFKTKHRRLHWVRSMARA